MFTQPKSSNKGSSLLAVSIITIAAITVLGALAIIITLLLEGVFGWQQSLYAQVAADSAVEDTMLQLVRNPDYNPDPNDYLYVNSAKASVTIQREENSSVYEMDVVGLSGVYVRKSKIIFWIDEGKPVILRESQG